MLARAPRQEPEEEAEEEAAAAASAVEGGGRWVTARVLGIRTTRSQSVEYKVSLDGYDSENDEWMEGDDERLQPYQAATDAKASQKQWAQEKDEARRLNERRRHEAGALHTSAIGE